MTKARTGKSNWRGFTLIEVLVVILIIGILAAYFGQNIFGQTNDAKISVAKTQLLESFPSAIASMMAAADYQPWSTSRAQNRYGIAINNEPPFWARGIKKQTPWGLDWYVASFPSNTHGSKDVRVIYPTGSGSDAKANAEQLARGLEQSKGRMMTNISVTTDSIAHADWRGVAGTYAVSVTYRSP